MTEGREFTIPRVQLHMADGTTAVVSITNPDRLRWDMEAPRRKWGRASDVPVLAQTFITWAAAKREKVTDLTWDEFQTQLLGLEDLPEEPVVIRPTRTGATDGLS